MEELAAKVAIVGGGPAGIGIAVGLQRAGVKDILLIDRNEHLGGIPGCYPMDGVPTFILWNQLKVVPGGQFAAALISRLGETKVQLHMQSSVQSISPSERSMMVVSPHRGCYRIKADAIVLACGAREKSIAERQWLFGKRPSRVYNSYQLLELKQKGISLAPANFGIVATEEISYAMAAKLAQEQFAAKPPVMIHHGKQPKRFSLAGMFFKRWSGRLRVIPTKEANIKGTRAVHAVRTFGGEDCEVAVDYLLIAGELVPNTELLAATGLTVDPKSRKVPRYQLSHLKEQGVFLAGNILGGSSGGQWAYFQGRLVARKILRFLGHSHTSKAASTVDESISR